MLLLHLTMTAARTAVETRFAADARTACRISATRHATYKISAERLATKAGDLGRVFTTDDLTLTNAHDQAALRVAAPLAQLRTSSAVRDSAASGTGGAGKMQTENVADLACRKLRIEPSTAITFCETRS
ncbi:MAG: hypothetical protein VYD57_11575 [Pseudomonadota bacterium]|nr:hypothetical protein [Pseudomonadota bacterium]